MIHFHLFSIWCPIISNLDNLLLFLYFIYFFFFFISYPITTIPHQSNFVTTFIISALAIWVLNGRFVTNFVILYLLVGVWSFSA